MASILPPAERRSVVLVATYAALSLLLLVIGDHLPVSWMRGAGAFVFEPLDRFVLSGDRLFAAWRENGALHERLTLLEIENAKLRAAGAENRQLRARLGLPEWHGLALKAVEVVALSDEPTPTAATLSAGADLGVKPGDALVTSDGLVGRVTEVWARGSRAALLTDPNLAVACEIETTGVNGVLRFSPSPTPRLLLSAVPLADTIRVGEDVMTSDLSLRFARGIPVGRVVRIRRDATGLMQEVEVRPRAMLSRLRHAFVVPGPVSASDGSLPRPRTEFEPVRTVVMPAPPGPAAAKAAAPAAGAPATATPARTDTARGGRR